MLRKLELLAYEVMESDTEIKYYRICFPCKWYDELSNIYGLLMNRKNASLPNKSLNSAIEALPLDIVKTQDFNWKNKSGDRVWMISLSPVEKDVILEVLTSWIAIEILNHKTINKDLRKKAIELIEKLDKNDIQIEEDIFCLSNFERHGNNTFKGNGQIYDLLSEYMASYVAKHRLVLEMDDIVLKFMKYRNELISYPVLSHSGCHYSYAIRFNVKTIAGYDKPIVLISSSIKRWANGAFSESLGWKRKTAAFIKYNDGFYGNEVCGYSFGRESIKGDYSKKQFYWHERTKDILEHASMAYLPEMQKLLSESESFLGSNSKYNILISYNNDNWSNVKNSVKKGMSINEKYKIYNWILKEFKFLKPVNEREYKHVSRRYRGSKLKKQIRISDYLDELSGRRDKVIFEIMYSNMDVPKKIISFLKSELSVSEAEVWQDGNITMINYNKISIEIRSIYSKDLINEMDDYDSKVKQLEGMVNDSEEEIATIVEIKKKEQYKEDRDPKYAIRKGLYRKGRLNQFITSDKFHDMKENDESRKIKPQENLGHILNSVFLDLFRQMGIFIDKIRIKGLKGIPENLEIVGFSLLSTNRNLKFDELSVPIAVSILSNTKEIFVKTPFDNEWMEYKEALLHLGSMKYSNSSRASKKFMDADINRFFISVVNDIKESDSLVLVDTSNRLNSVFKDFQDKNIELNSYGNEFKKVRFIRVKSNLDIPEGIGLNEEGSASFILGVKRVTDNVYYSLEGKTITYKKINSMDRKYKWPSKEFKLPRALEIIPVKLNDEDDIDSFVYFTHILRQLNITYYGYTSMPCVNHLCKSFQEVLLSKDVALENIGE